jgi:hypothetical protein
LLQMLGALLSTSRSVSRIRLRDVLMYSPLTVRPQYCFRCRPASALEQQEGERGEHGEREQGEITHVLVVDDFARAIHVEVDAVCAAHPALQEHAIDPGEADLLALGRADPCALGRADAAVVVPGLGLVEPGLLLVAQALALGLLLLALLRELNGGLLELLAPSANSSVRLCERMLSTTILRFAVSSGTIGNYTDFIHASTRP